MDVEIKGPIVNNAYNSEMRAISIYNHICVDSVSETNNSITVYREKMFTLSENSSTIKRESFYIKSSETTDIKEMLQFIKYHFELAINTNELTTEEITCHRKAIEMIETEINKREDLKKVTYKYLLINLIKEKEFEIEQLKLKLNDLEEI